MKYILTIAILVIFLNILAQTEIYDLWNEVLQENVKEDTGSGITYNSFNYRNLKDDERFLDILQALKEFKPETMLNIKEKLAFWINVYNITAVKMILENDIPESIKNIGSFFRPVWKKPAIEIGNRIYTLAEIEHDILRSYQEPLIHFAIVCASLSCPDLRDEAYYPDSVMEQMEDNTVKFLQNNTKGIRLDKANGVVYLSRIFNWFKEDFPAGRIEFLEKYTNHSMSDLKIKYLDYNWSLNLPQE